MPLRMRRNLGKQSKPATIGTPSNFQSNSQHLIPPKCTLQDKVPFGIRHDLIVETPVNPLGTIDVYIGDFIGLTINL
jgi:hypothetical protein